MPSARYSVSTPKGPGPAPVNFITQRRPSPVSISAGEVLACGSTSSTRGDASPPGGTGVRRAWRPLCGAQIFLLVK